MIEAVRDLIARSARIVAFTGAGISAESGIPTFRGSGGLWKQFRPEDLATPEAFRRDPKLVWKWYDWRRQIIARAEPNAGHRALAELERRKPEFALITQNVDGLHDRARSRHVLKLHGDIWTVRCTRCGRGSEDRRAALPSLPPECGCGGLLRPGVVWFGESLDGNILNESGKLAKNAEVFLTIGTSAVVYPAARLIDIARSGGAVVVEVNPEQTAFSYEVDYSLRGPSGEILPQLLPPSGLDAPARTTVL
jgi:NAD-dependent deacetylase